MFRPGSRLAFVVSVAFMANATSAHAQVAPRPPAAKAPKADLIARGAQLFEDQQYEESIQVLGAALLLPQNSRAEKVEIYRLLALDYITLNRSDESESAVRALLSIDPEYAIPATESPRFRDFFAGARSRWESEGRPGLVVEAKVETPVTLRHASPVEATPDEPIALRARIVDPGSRFKALYVHYRTGTRGSFAEFEATRRGDLVTMTIPASAVHGPLVEYYLEGVGKDGLPVFARGDATAPLRIAVKDARKPWVLPVAIGGGVLGAAAILGGLALAGVFSSAPSANNPGSNTPGGTSRVVVSITE